MLNRIAHTLEEVGADLSKLRLDDSIAISFSTQLFEGTILISYSQKTNRYYAEYYSDNVDIRGKLLLPYTTIVNTLNYQNTSLGKWSFIVSEKKGYFYYCYCLGDEAYLRSLSNRAFKHLIQSFATSIENDFRRELLCIHRLILLCDEDNGVGPSLGFSIHLTTDFSYEQQLSDVDLNKLLVLQSRFELDDTIPLSVEQLEMLEKLYDAQIAEQQKVQKELSVNIHRHMSRAVKNQKKLETL